MKSKLLSIVIPIYNEEETIVQILKKIAVVELLADVKKEIIIVNDCSSDNTEEVLLNYTRQYPMENIKYFKQTKNMGKGAALRKGFELADGEFVIIQDADNEYDPAEYNILLNPMLNNFADVVYGSRFMGGKPHRILFFWHSVGNKFLTTLLNMVTNLNLSDMETCYKLFRSDLLKDICLIENRFGFEPEITAKIARIPNVRIYEVGISYYGRTYYDGKKINWIDGIRAIYCIFKYGLLKL